MTNPDAYTATLLEDIRDQNRAVLEAVGQMQDTMQYLVRTSELVEVKQDVKVIKKVVTAISRQQIDHEMRITRLEKLHAS